MAPKGWRGPIEHGTRRGYQAHLRRGEEACQACLDAHTGYTGEHRNRPDQAAYQRARRRALTRLAERHRGEYALLLADERAREVA